MLSLNDRGKLVPSSARCFPNGVRECYRVELRSGTFIDVTDNHPLLTLSDGFNWTEVRDLSVGDRVGSARTLPIENTISNVTESEAILLGLYIGKYSYEKSVPAAIFTEPNYRVAQFIGALWSCDGWVCVRSPREKGVWQVGYSSSSEQLSREVKTLLLRFGIKARIRCKKTPCRDVWVIELNSASDIVRFAESIPLWGDKREKLLLARETHSQSPDHSSRDTVPISIYSTIERLCVEHDVSPDVVGHKRPTGKYNLTKLQKLAEYFKDETLSNIAYSDIFWDEIVSITSIGEFETFGIEVDEYHNYVAHDMIVHNSVSLCVDMLWHAFTRADYQILVACPFQSQVKVIFDTLNRLIKDSDFINSSIKYNRTNPYELVFLNGSTILGFTAGSSSGQKGSNIRGNNANYIVLDEFDYLGDEAVAAIIAIMATNRDTKLWVSSTPTGARGTFYLWATDSTYGFECFHYSSHESPEFTEEADKFFRGTMTKEQYDHEILAEFGILSEGVYRHSDIDQCIYSYRYGDPNPDNPVVLGVDWNSEKVGCELCSVEYLREPEELEMFDGREVKSSQEGYHEEILHTRKVLVGGKYKVFRMDTISRKDYTLNAAVDMIINLFKKYKYNYVYIDKGYGAMAEETLREKSKEQNLTLHDRLVAIDFGSIIDKARDPITKKKIKKRAKYFIVENSVRVVENHDLILPISEEEKTRLIGQLREYRVERRNESGIPVYSKGNDHKLDALNLALTGFRLEMFDDTQTSFSVTPVYNPGFIQPLLERVDDRASSVGTTSNDALRSVPKRGPAMDQTVQKFGLSYVYVQKKNNKNNEKHCPSSGSTQLPYHTDVGGGRAKSGRRWLAGRGGRRTF